MTWVLRTLAIHVGDVEAAMTYLESHGCTPCGDPLVLTDVPQAGITVLYVRSPIGLYLEHVSHPRHGAAVRQAGGAKLLPRAREWRNE